MTKSVAYVQKYFAQILLAAVLGYIGWMGLELNAIGKDVATLKANTEHVDYRLTAVEKRLDSMTKILVRIEQGMLLYQGGKGNTKRGRAEKP